MTVAGTETDYRVLGIRHHGPGSSRALVRALEAMQPDCIVLENPADADPLIAQMLANTSDDVLEPPVAIMAWCTDDPRNSAVWPFAVFSPEWQTLVWAKEHDVPVRSMDLPSSLMLTKKLVPDAVAEDDIEQEQPNKVRIDPIAALAEVVGYDDPEAWWEDAIELAPGQIDPFDLLAEAMAQLRDEYPETDNETLVREAQMRQTIRACRSEFSRVAVVCGAWHTPALLGKFPAKSADSQLIRALPKTKTQMTWVPWTHSRLARWTGYGAGVTSPGWYHHLFTAQDEPIVRWLQHVAEVLRDNDLPVSSAHVIEATRLADSLAALRGRPMPGLTEVTEATWSVIVDGSDLLLDLVSREAVIGEALGNVPEGMPSVPLDADLRATAKRLRLSFEATEKLVTLDLRKAKDIEKSQLFLRLQILDIPWATPESVRTSGTFKEAWKLQWHADSAMAIIEAAGYGNTVELAAGRALLARATTLPDVTKAIEDCLLAHLVDVLDELLQALDDRAAHENDIIGLLQAIAPLARSSRYGDVRGTDKDRLLRIAKTVLARACAGLPVACAGLSAEAARDLTTHLDHVHDVVPLLDEETRQLWCATLAGLADQRNIPTYLAGRLTRILFDQDILDSDQTVTRLSLALSYGASIENQAGWIEGFLIGSPLLIIHDSRLLLVLNSWVAQLPDDNFIEVLPVLRRAFGRWSPSARRQVAHRVEALRSIAASAQSEQQQWDLQLLATVASFLGVADE